MILTYTAASDPCAGGTYHWTGASGGSWITPGNWSSATNGAGDCTSYPNAVTAAVLFDKTAESDTVVMPNSTISVGAITFPNDTVTFQGNAGGSSVLSTNGTSSTVVGPTFDTNMTLTINAGTFTVTSGQTLTINKALTTV